MTDVQFSVVSAHAEPHAAAPTIVFRVAIDFGSLGVVEAALMRCQVFIEMRRRQYSDTESDRLSEIVAERARWHDTMRPLLWTTVPLVLTRCEGTTQTDLLISCTYDFDVAAAKYFRALNEGEIPLLFQFSGTIFGGGQSEFQVAPVPWAAEARFRLPVSIWRDAMGQHFGDTTWIRLQRDSFEALDDLRRRRGFVSWDQVVDALCAEQAAASTEPL